MGVWAGTSYRQWFSADGTTIYAPRGQRSTVGKWRIATDGAYESWWSGELWERYEVANVEGTLVWRDEKSQDHPFEMLDGQQLVWPD